MYKFYGNISPGGIIMKKTGLFLAMLLMMSMVGFVSAHQVTVDGDPSDWQAYTSTQKVNTWHLYSNAGEWVWKDATGDVRTDIQDCNSCDPGDTDITEIRITSDQDYVYILVKFRDINKVGGYLEDGTEPFGNSKRGLGLIITIDTDQQSNSGQTWLPKYSNTQVNSNAAWERAVFITTANDGWNYNKAHIYADYNEFDIYDPSWNDVGSHNSEAVIDADNDVIEMKLYKGDLGIQDLSSSTIRITVSTIVHDWSTGNAVIVGDQSNSNVVDVMTTESSTWDEVSDGYIDYYTDIDISQVPFFSNLAVVLAFVLGVVLLFRRL